MLFASIVFIGLVDTSMCLGHAKQSLIMETIEINILSTHISVSFLSIGLRYLLKMAFRFPVELIQSTHKKLCLFDPKL